jgi:hypothetical protein
MSLGRKIVLSEILMRLYIKYPNSSKNMFSKNFFLLLFTCSLATSLYDGENAILVDHNSKKNVFNDSRNAILFKAWDGKDYKNNNFM